MLFLYLQTTEKYLQFQNLFRVNKGRIAYVRGRKDLLAASKLLCQLMAERV